jgi:hypothetical protein
MIIHGSNAKGVGHCKQRCFLENKHEYLCTLSCLVAVIDAGAYLDLLLGGTQIFSLIQAQNLQVKFLVIFISSESLIFVVFFFFF